MVETQRHSPAVAPLWILLLCGGVIIGLTAGMRQVSGLYLPPVRQALGIGIEPFSTAMAVANLLWGVSAIAAGALADKYGAGRVAFAGLLLMMFGYYAMYSATTGDDLLWSGIGLGLGTGSTGATVMIGAVARATTAENRTSALATLTIANGIGSFVVFPYVHIFIGALGWQASILVIIATLGATLPLAIYLSSQDRSAAPSQRPQPFGDALSEAFKLPSYWLLNVGFFVCGFQVAFYAAHVPAYAASLGFGGWVGVAALTAVGAANIVGTWLAGKSVKYMEQRRVLSAIYFARSVVFLGFLILPMNAPVLIVLSALLGLFWLATAPVTSSLVATFFGTSWLSTLVGIVFFSHQVGAFIGVWLAGVLYDATKSYDAMWWISIALGLLAAAVHWPIREEAVPRLRAAMA